MADCALPDPLRIRTQAAVEFVLAAGRRLADLRLHNTTVLIHQVLPEATSIVVDIQPVSEGIGTVTLDEIRDAHDDVLWSYTSTSAPGDAHADSAAGHHRWHGGLLREIEHQLTGVLDFLQPHDAGWRPHEHTATVERYAIDLTREDSLFAQRFPRWTVGALSPPRNGATCWAVRLHRADDLTGLLTMSLFDMPAPIANSPSATGRPSPAELRGAAQHLATRELAACLGYRQIGGWQHTFADVFLALFELHETPPRSPDAP